MPCDSGPTAALLLLRSLGGHVRHTPTLCLLFIARVSGVRASLYPHQREDSPAEAQELRTMSGRARVRARGMGPRYGAREVGSTPGNLMVSVSPRPPCGHPAVLPPACFSSLTSPCFPGFPPFFCFSPKWLDTVVETWKGEKLCG